MMIIVIGRGHSGTRSIAQTLYASNVYMGSLLNNSCDFVPPHNLYRSCHIFSKYVKYSGNYKWDFSEALGQEVPQSFKKLILSSSSRYMTVLAKLFLISSYAC